MNILPNGATILKIDYLAGVILASETYKNSTKFITWEFYGGDLSTTAGGHYFEDGDIKDNLSEALDDFNIRAKNLAHYGRIAATEQSFTNWVGERTEPVMNEELKERLGRELAIVLGLEQKSNGRYDLPGGDKTDLGLYRTMKRTMNQKMVVNDNRDIGFENLEA